MLAEPIVDFAPEAYVPNPDFITRAERRVTTLERLAEIHLVRKGIEDEEKELIRSAKNDGATWKDIGDAMLTTRQAVCKSYARLLR